MVQKGMERGGIRTNVQKLLAIEEKLRSLARSLERLSIQMEEQHFRTNGIRKLLIDHHAFGSLLGDELSEERRMMKNWEKLQYWSKK